MKRGLCTLGYSRRTERSVCGCHVHAVMLRQPDIEPYSLEQRAKRLAAGMDQLAASEEGNTAGNTGFARVQEGEKQTKEVLLALQKILLNGNI